MQVRQNLQADSSWHEGTAAKQLAAAAKASYGRREGKSREADPYQLGRAAFRLDLEGVSQEDLEQDSTKKKSKVQ